MNHFFYNIYQRTIVSKHIYRQTCILTTLPNFLLLNKIGLEIRIRRDSFNLECPLRLVL